MDVKIFPKPKEEKIEVGDIVEYAFAGSTVGSLAVIVCEWGVESPIHLVSVNDWCVISSYRTIDGVRIDPDVYFVAKGSDCKLDIFKEE